MNQNNFADGLVFVFCIFFFLNILTFFLEKISDVNHANIRHSFILFKMKTMS